MTEESAEAFANRIARSHGIELNFCRGGRSTRLWIWPKESYEELPHADREYIRTHKAELKELLRSGRAPRLDDIAAAAAAAALVCPYCHQTPCIGESHSAFDVLHYNDPRVATSRVRAADKAATAEMMSQVGKGVY